MAVRAGGHVYLFEFKVTEQAGAGAAPGRRWHSCGSVTTRPSTGAGASRFT